MTAIAVASVPKIHQRHRTEAVRNEAPKYQRNAVILTVEAQKHQYLRKTELDSWEAQPRKRQGKRGVQRSDKRQAYKVLGLKDLVFRHKKNSLFFNGGWTKKTPYLIFRASRHQYIIAHSPQNCNTLFE